MFRSIGLQCAHHHVPLLQPHRPFSTINPSIPILHYEHHRPSVTPIAPTSTLPPPSPIVILHGLFGSKQNWRSLSKLLANRMQTDVYALDLRNHGDSFHSASHSYPLMTEDLERFLDARGMDRVNLVGHSMGGKVVMNFALKEEARERLENLVVVDMSPAAQNLASEFGSYIQAMKRVLDVGVTTKDQADGILAQSIDSLSLRQFILTNLRKVPGDSQMSFRINLPVLEESLNGLWKFPVKEGQAQYDGPTLFIGGKKANYITEKTKPVIRRYFPKAIIEELDAGHW
ncbi:hypothetical protein HKX48_002235 [Thoreauomyces humboldtii]|nr:hypothetical protein HKX48_002235 [Thoreauomyces humboldtii]